MQAGDIWHLGPAPYCVSTLIWKDLGPEVLMIIVLNDRETGGDVCYVQNRTKEYMTNDSNWHAAKECPNGPIVAV